MHGDHQSVTLFTTPAGTNIVIDNRVYMLAPGTVNLSRKTDHHATFAKDGCDPATYTIKRTWSWMVRFSSRRSASCTTSTKAGTTPLRTRSTSRSTRKPPNQCRQNTVPCAQILSPHSSSRDGIQRAAFTHAVQYDSYDFDYPTALRTTRVNDDCGYLTTYRIGIHPLS